MSDEPNQWIQYLKATGNYERYDGTCDCYVCRQIVKDFEVWKSRLTTTPIPETPDSLRTRITTLESQLAQREEQLRVTHEERDKEIGDFQNEVRNLVIKLSGAPDSDIDGKVSDGGWQEFTLAEISQGFNHVTAQLSTALDVVRECEEALSTCKRFQAAMGLSASHSVSRHVIAALTRAQSILPKEGETTKGEM